MAPRSFGRHLGLWMHSPLDSSWVLWMHLPLNASAFGRTLDQHVEALFLDKRLILIKFSVRLVRINQGSKSIEEYYKDIKVALMRANALESNEATMPQFLHGLNRELHDIVELYHYTSLDDLVHQATRVESQQRRCLVSKRTYPNGSSSWKGKDREREPPRRTRVQRRGVPHHNAKCLGKGHIASQSPNKRNIIMRKDGNVESESSLEEPSSNSEDESSSDYSHDDGALFMVIRCHVKGKLCSIIIDGGSCVNIASLRPVKKLDLPTIVHLRP
ncbi:hypothetical protein CR513_42264, partial [Mucuna pruriens]